MNQVELTAHIKQIIKESVEKALYNGENCELYPIPLRTLEEVITSSFSDFLEQFRANETGETYYFVSYIFAFGHKVSFVLDILEGTLSIESE